MVKPLHCTIPHPNLRNNYLRLVLKYRVSDE